MGAGVGVPYAPGPILSKSVTVFPSGNHFLRKVSNEPSARIAARAALKALTNCDPFGKAKPNGWLTSYSGNSLIESTFTPT